MSTQALIEQARASGVELRLVAGKVRASGTRDDVTRLIGPLRQHNADLLRWLTQKGNDDQVRSAGSTPDSDPDRQCCPHGAAMTQAEIDTFTARLARISDMGLGQTDIEMWADKLLTRDRESDDRSLCLECTHLSGSRTSSWRCENWRLAGIALRARDADLPWDFVRLLQRCLGFTSVKLRPCV